MRMRVEFNVDEDGFDEQVFSEVTNDYLTVVDGSDANWARMDPPSETTDPPTQSSLSPGNSAYTPDSGGEVNSPASALAAQQGAAEAVAEGEPGQADPDEQQEPPRSTVETPIVVQVQPVEPEAEEQMVEQVTAEPQPTNEPTTE